MTSGNKYLFLGGILHRKWRITDNKEYIVIYSKNDECRIALLQNEGRRVNFEYGFKKYVYRRMEFRNTDVVETVYAWEKNSNDKITKEYVLYKKWLNDRKYKRYYYKMKKYENKILKKRFLREPIKRCLHYL